MPLKMLSTGRLAALSAFAGTPLITLPMYCTLFKADITPADDDIDDTFLNNEADFHFPLLPYQRIPIVWRLPATTEKEFGVMRGDPCLWRMTPEFIPFQTVYGYFVMAFKLFTPVVLWAERFKVPIPIGADNFAIVNPVLTARSLFHP
jgi:hypothetical protein